MRFSAEEETTVADSRVELVKEITDEKLTGALADSVCDAIIKAIALLLGDDGWNVCLVFTDDKSIHELNLETRGIDSALKLSWERPDEHTLIYHIFFPAATLPYISFREGTSFGFSLLVNDDDGKGRKDGLTLAPKGTEPFRNPHLYKDLVLIR